MMIAFIKTKLRQIISVTYGIVTSQFHRVYFICHPIDYVREGAKTRSKMKPTRYSVCLLNTNTDHTNIIHLVKLAFPCIKFFGQYFFLFFSRFIRSSKQNLFEILFHHLLLLRSAELVGIPVGE